MSLEKLVCLPIRKGEPHVLRFSQTGKKKKDGIIYGLETESHKDTYLLVVKLLLPGATPRCQAEGHRIDSAVTFSDSLHSG